MPHVHTPHSLGIWKKRQMEIDYPGDTAKFEQQYNFTKRIHWERRICADADLVIATTPSQLSLLAQEYQVPANKCRMVPPGYDDNRFFPVGEGSCHAIRQRLELSGKVVMAIGRLAQQGIRSVDSGLLGTGVARTRSRVASCGGRHQCD